MALEIKQTLRLAQQLVITPQLQQAIKLLQLSRLELQNLVQHELMENPVLEENEPDKKAEEDDEVSVTERMDAAHEKPDGQQKVDEIGTKDGELKEPNNFDWENYLGTYNSSESSASSGPKEMRDAPPSYENKPGPHVSLQDHLLWQLHLSNTSTEETLIAEDIISTINDEGYFQGNIDEVAQSNNCTAGAVESVLTMIQEYDPAGVGSRDLAECLLVQIRPFEKDKAVLTKLIQSHLGNLEKRNYTAIAKNLNISMERLKELSHIITTLEPKPGRPFGVETPHYIIPDVYIEKIGQDYVVILNDDGLPKLQISNFYRNAMFKNEMPTGAKQYVQDKLRSAMWLIRSIHQRQRTLYRVTQSIVKFQRDFLEKGVSSLKPMILRDVAQDIQMHESTVSRVTTNKYVQTPRGLFELKFFFNTKVPRSSGDGITSEAVKLTIKKMIGKEDTRHPLSDQQIAVQLKGEDIVISRRTVAKYRELMGISSSSRRRQVL